LRQGAVASQLTSTTKGSHDKTCGLTLQFDAYATTQGWEAGFEPKRT